MEIKFYINGEQDENVASATGKIERTTNPVLFGGDWPAGCSYYLQGVLDEVKISNFAKTAEEIEISMTQTP